MERLVSGRRRRGHGTRGRPGPPRCPQGAASAHYGPGRPPRGHPGLRGPPGPASRSGTCAAELRAERLPGGLALPASGRGAPRAPGGGGVAERGCGEAARRAPSGRGAGGLGSARPRARLRSEGPGSRTAPRAERPFSPPNPWRRGLKGDRGGARGGVRGRGGGGDAPGRGRCVRGGHGCRWGSLEEGHLPAVPAVAYLRQPGPQERALGWGWAPGTRWAPGVIGRTTNSLCALATFPGTGTKYELVLRPTAAVSSRSCLGPAPVNSAFVRGVRGGPPHQPCPQWVTLRRLLNFSGLSLHNLNGVDTRALPSRVLVGTERAAGQCQDGAGQRVECLTPPRPPTGSLNASLPQGLLPCQAELFPCSCPGFCFRLQLSCRSERSS